jgi:Fe-S oxidoreductase
MGWEADAKLLRRAGAELVRLGGCCGLAGNFGVERGHYDVSVQVAEQQLLPALRNAKEGDVFLADGFSCRTQSADLAGVPGTHLVQLLAGKKPR